MSFFYFNSWGYFNLLFLHILSRNVEILILYDINKKTKIYSFRSKNMKNIFFQLLNTPKCIKYSDIL